MNHLLKLVAMRAIERKERHDIWGIGTVLPNEMYCVPSANGAAVALTLRKIHSKPANNAFILMLSYAQLSDGINILTF